MNWIDFLILLVLLVSSGLGIWRGFIHETLSLLSWVAAFIVARVFSPDVAHWLEQYIEPQALVLLLSWLLPFLITFLAFTLLKILLVSLVKVTGLRPIDRLLGAGFGALKGIMLVTAVVLVIQLSLSRSSEAFKTESKFVPHFQVIALWMLKTLDQDSGLSFENIVGRFNRVVDANFEKIDIDSWKQKLGLTTDEINSLFNDEQKLTQLKALINNPEALKKLQESLADQQCNNGNCKD